MPSGSLIHLSIIITVLNTSKYNLNIVLILLPPSHHASPTYNCLGTWAFDGLENSKTCVMSALPLYTYLILANSLLILVHFQTFIATGAMPLPFPIPSHIYTQFM
eukprot:5428994-Ditylum_brightwellii.AAC.1